MEAGSPSRQPESGVHKHSIRPKAGPVRKNSYLLSYLQGVLRAWKC